MSKDADGIADKSDTVKGELSTEINSGTKEAMIFAMEKSLCVVSTAVRTAGISRDTHYRWMREDAAYSDKITELENVALDFAESKLHQLIQKNNVAAILFYLKTKGKDRGYVERQETVRKQIHVKLNRTGE